MSQRNQHPPVTASTLIQLRRVRKEYRTAAGRFVALADVDLDVQAGEFAAIVGKSGSGKSTLLNMVTGIDRPTSGEVVVDGVPVHRLGEGESAAWRGRNVGVVFQFFQLLPALTVLENVLLPMDLVGVWPARDRDERARYLLDQVGMAAHADKLPSATSGGQQQRVAIARALANDPVLLMADEPTGNLDSAAANIVFELFHALADAGKTVLMVTHDEELAARTRREIHLADGHVVGPRGPSRTENLGAA